MRVQHTQPCGHGDACASAGRLSTVQACTPHRVRVRATLHPSRTRLSRRTGWRLSSNEITRCNERCSKSRWDSLFRFPPSVLVVCGACSLKPVLYDVAAASEVPSRPPQRASSLSLRPIRPKTLLDADSMLSLCTCASRAPHLVVEVVRPDARRIVRPVRHRGVGSGRTDVNALVEEQVRAAQYSRRTCRVVA